MPGGSGSGEFTGFFGDELGGAKIPSNPQTPGQGFQKASVGSQSRTFSGLIGALWKVYIPYRSLIEAPYTLNSPPVVSFKLVFGSATSLTPQTPCVHCGVSACKGLGLGFRDLKGLMQRVSRQ